MHQGVQSKAAHSTPVASTMLRRASGLRPAAHGVLRGAHLPSSSRAISPYTCRRTEGRQPVQAFTCRQRRAVRQGCVRRMPMNKSKSTKSFQSIQQWAHQVEEHVVGGQAVEEGIDATGAQQPAGRRRGGRHQSPGVSSGRWRVRRAASGARQRAGCWTAAQWRWCRRASRCGKLALTVAASHGSRACPASSTGGGECREGRMSCPAGRRTPGGAGSTTWQGARSPGSQAYLVVLAVRVEKNAVKRS